MSSRNKVYVGHGCVRRVRWSKLSLFSAVRSLSPLLTCSAALLNCTPYKFKRRERHKRTIAVAPKRLLICFELREVVTLLIVY